MNIKIKNLVKRYDEENTIKYPDLEFESGRTYMITGESGCGKTSLLNMIAGITGFDSGDIIINDDKMSEMTQKQKDDFRVKNIGYVYQDYKLLNNMTVRDNIEVLSLENINTRSNLKPMLDLLKISEKENSKISALSGGQKQRVAIARAMIKNPAIMLCDEPTGNLNTEISHELMKEITSLSKSISDKILITVTHDKSLAQYFDEVISL